MPGAVPYGLVGSQQPADNFVADTVQRTQLGGINFFVDPYYGFAQCVYGKAGAAMGTGRVVVPDANFTMTDVGNTANLGVPVYVAMANMANNTYGWFCYTGQRPVQAQASVAAGSVVGIGAAGKVGASSAGKEIVGMMSTQPSTFTVTFKGDVVQGKSVINVLSPNPALFVGLTLSVAVGLVSSQTITGISSDGRQITISANADGQAPGATITATFTGFIIAHFQSPTAQGRIT